MKFDTALLIQVVITFLFGALTSYVSHTKGRNSTLWFLIGIFLGWIGLLVAFLLPPAEATDPAKSSKVGVQTLPVVSEPVPEPLAEKPWYYLDKEHKQYGPVSFLLLHELWKKGELIEESLVWQEGMKEWTAISNLPEMAAKFRSQVHIFEE